MYKKNGIHKPINAQTASATYIHSCILLLQFLHLQSNHKLYKISEKNTVMHLYSLFFASLIYQHGVTAAWADSPDCHFCVFALTALCKRENGNVLQVFGKGEYGNVVQICFKM